MQQQQQPSGNPISRPAAAALRAATAERREEPTALPAGLRRCSAAINHGGRVARCAYPVYNRYDPTVTQAEYYRLRRHPANPPHKYHFSLISY